MAKSKEEILQQISRAEKALANQGLSEGAKSNIRKTVEQLNKDLAAMEESVEKKEEKIEKKEAEAKQDFDAEIRKLEEQLKRNPPAKVKEIFERKLKEAKEKKAEIEKEAKEDKAEAKQELKEVKEAVKDLEKAVKKGGRTAPIKKPKIEEKAREKKSEKRVKEMKSSMSELEKLVNEVKELREKYKGKRVDLKRDAGRSAKPFGYRFVGPNDYRVPTEKQIEEGKKRGTIDYEARPNRSDKYPVGYKGDVREKLADGGMMAKGGKVRYQIIQDVSDSDNPSGAYLVVDTQKDKILAEFDFKKEAQEFIRSIDDGKMADGGMMAKGGYSDKASDLKGGVKHYSVDIDLENGDNVRDLEFKNIDRAKKVYDKYSKSMMYEGDKIDDIQLIVVYKNGDHEKMMSNGGMMAKADGGMMAKGGKTKGKMRKNSANRFKWTKEAVKDGIITKDKLKTCPSQYQRKKYPAYIIEK